MSDTTDGRRPSDGPSFATELEDMLGELVRDWDAGTPRRLRTYLDGRPTLRGRPEAIVELINQEVVLRQMRGEAPRPADYHAEFPEVAGSVDRLFEVHDLASDAPGAAGTTQVRSSTDPLPTIRPAGDRRPTIPGYEIERFLGRGGMGVVYLARHRGLNRLVALKLIQESRRDDPGLVSRFRREAEAAARCQHPNLVQIHDIGEHDGEPYLALEYVAGGHLGRALAGEPRPPREAAELVETLARAIDHAHAQGVVHRDLKPANVLLTPEGQPKIADFGLAKLRDSTTETELGTVLGTLSYMAPEQVQARIGEIGPRTDIHALGAILYEAMTGRPPYRAETPQQILHAILAEEVVAPSARQPGIPRDLEAICRKCLEKEAARRYATAADLAEDLRRFLDGRPTEARPPSAAERGLRWCRKNRWAVAAIAALVLLTAVSAWQAVRTTIAERSSRADRERAETEAEIAQAVNDFLTQDILGRAWIGSQPFVDPTLSNEIKVSTALDIATEKIGERFRGRPLVEAAIRYAIGRAYEELQLPAKAGPQFERAIALWSGTLGEQDPRTLNARCRLGLALLLQQRPADAERQIRPAWDGLIAVKGGNDPDALIATQMMGVLLFTQGRRAEGRELVMRALEGLRASRGPAHPETLDATQQILGLLLEEGKREEARHVLEEAIRIADRQLGEDHGDAIDAKVRLVPFFGLLGDQPELVRRLEALLPIEGRVLGKGHYATLWTMAELSSGYLLTDRVAKAEPLLLNALTELRGSFDRYSALTSLVLGNLATYNITKRDLDRARDYLSESVDITRGLRGTQSSLTDQGATVLSHLYLMTRELAAERYLRDHRAYLLRNAPEAAERYLAEGWIGYCLIHRKAFPQAEEALGLAYNWFLPGPRGAKPEERDGFRKLLDRVVEAYQAAGDRDRAALWKARRSDLDFPDEPFGDGLIEGWLRSRQPAGTAPRP